MQQRPRGTPPPFFNFAIGAILVLTGIVDLAFGVSHATLGYLLTGAGATAYGVLLLREGWHIRKTGQRAMAPRRMAQAGFLCLAIFLAGVIAKGMAV
jgi:hypothetical protein